MPSAAPPLDLDARVRPDYAGGGLWNLATSIAAHFGLPPGGPTLRSPLPLEGIDSVVLLLVDGFGHHQWQRHAAAGDLPTLARLAGAGRYATLTSVFPSTTMAAMTTLHTGVPPAQHGFLGYTVHASEVDEVVNLIYQTRERDGQPLSAPDFLSSVPTLYARLREVGVQSHLINPAAYQGTFLTDWYASGSHHCPYAALTEVPGLVAHAARAPGYVVAYLPEYDGTCHVHGVSSPQARAVLTQLDALIGETVRRLPRPQSTLLLVSADHGHRDLAPEGITWLDADPAYAALLRGHPAGEPRVHCPRLRPGQLEAALDRLGRMADVLPAQDAWLEGWYGGPPASERFRNRVGDLIAVPKAGGAFAWSFGGTHQSLPLLGAHGGWTEAEMRIPLLQVRA